jgi:aspartate racemase
VLVDINPKVPDRNVDGSAPGPVLAAMASGLRVSGAQVLAIACNTAHAYAEDVRASGLPLIDMLETAGLAARAQGAGVVGVLGTSLALGLYRDRFSQLGLEVVTLDDHEQVEFMALLYRIKRGDVGQASRDAMAALAHRLINKSAQAVIAGCTEVPLVLSQTELSTPFLDATQTLAVRCVEVCLGD